jgi:hypothetical protein
MDKVAQQLLEDALTQRSISQGRMSVEEFHQTLSAKAEGSENLRDLPIENFSRENFYAVPRR